MRVAGWLQEQLEPHPPDRVLQIILCYEVNRIVVSGDIIMTELKQLLIFIKNSRNCGYGWNISLKYSIHFPSM